MHKFVISVGYGRLGLYISESSKGQIISINLLRAAKVYFIRCRGFVVL